MIILASKSQIRAELLKNAGLDPKRVPADIDERTMELQWAHLPASYVAENLAIEKAKAVSLLYPDAYVIGSDQTLEIEGIRLSKAANFEIMRDNLNLMRGKTHYLHAAVSVAKAGISLFSKVETAHMTMINFSKEFLDNYIEKHGEKVKSSVGSYHFEGAGITLFETVEGSYHTILGMPLLPLIAFFRKEGMIAQ